MFQKLKESASMSKVKVGVAAVLAILIGIVIFQNTEPVETRVLFIKITMPRAGLLGTTLLIGIISGILLTLGWSAKRASTSAPISARRGIFFKYQSVRLVSCTIQKVPELARINKNVGWITKNAVRHPGVAGRAR